MIPIARRPIIKVDRYVPVSTKVTGACLANFFPVPSL